MSDYKSGYPDYMQESLRLVAETRVGRLGKDFTPMTAEQRQQILEKFRPDWKPTGKRALAIGPNKGMIIPHDHCCHGSFFATPRANRILGYITGILTFMPFEQWRRSHAMHHDTVGDLDRRGVGDIWTMTAAEFEAAPRWKRIAYRIIRNPIFFLTFGTLVIFLVAPRYFHRLDRKRERQSVALTDVALAAIIAGAALTIGIKTYLAIQIPVMFMAGAAGIWLFYVQHQFKGTYWERHEAWDPIRAALQGSSFYKLPKVLQWFTGNIGFHHVHHVQQRIPNYNLERCHDEVPVLQQIKPLTLLRSLESAPNAA